MSGGRSVDSLRSALGDAVRAHGPLAIAVSGGVDSVTLWAAAADAGVDVVAFHAASAAVPGDATARVRALAAARGWALHVVDAGELQDPRYAANPVNRCFFCKSNLYDTIAAHAGDRRVASGTNTDDLDDVRPGLAAAAARGVVHPFVEAGISKRDVRALASAFDLGDVAELPASPCLSSRVETGVPVRAELLAALHSVEEAARAVVGNNAAVRCRVRRDAAVLELDDEATARLDAAGPAVRSALQAHADAAFAAVGQPSALQFAPYRRGSAFLRVL